MASLQMQSVKPAAVIVSCVQDADVEPFNYQPAPILLTGEMGLTKQRNLALRNLPENISYVIFFDDDFVAHPKWIEVVESMFREHPDVAVITGNVIADGINGPGYTFEQAQDLIRNFKAENLDWIKEPYTPYGCNMAFRKSALKDIWFDERLVLYGWQEDRDFGAQVARRGRAIKVGAALGVHMGVKGGRVSGVRLGYSQVANPIYLYKKGTMTLNEVVVHIFRNFARNLTRAFAPEPHIDRAGRLRGNLLAFFDVSRGRVSPELASKF